MDVIEREIARPTDYWVKQHGGRVYEAESGAFVLIYSTYRDVLYDMGYINEGQAYAFDKFALMRYVATRHIGAKTTLVDEMCRVVGVERDDLPSLRDGFTYVAQRVSNPEMRTINIVISELPHECNIFAVKTGLTAIANEIDKAAHKLERLMREFNEKRSDYDN